MLDNSSKMSDSSSMILDKTSKILDSSSMMFARSSKILIFTSMILIYTSKVSACISTAAVIFPVILSAASRALAAVTARFVKNIFPLNKRTERKIIFYRIVTKSKCEHLLL